MALLAGSYLESQLAGAIARVLVKDAKFQASLLEGYGPLVTLRARVDIAHGLGLIPPAMYRALHQIRRVRNHFAHHPEATDFSEPAIADRCRTLDEFGVRGFRVSFSAGR